MDTIIADLTCKRMLSIGTTTKLNWRRLLRHHVPIHQEHPVRYLPHTTWFLASNQARTIAEGIATISSSPCTAITYLARRDEVWWLTVSIRLTNAGTLAHQAFSQKTRTAQLCQARECSSRFHIKPTSNRTLQVLAFITIRARQAVWIRPSQLNSSWLTVEEETLIIIISPTSIRKEVTIARHWRQNH